MTSSVNTPAPWAVEAAQLPVAFAQVREDPRLDAEVLATVRPGASVVMVASGGETAVHLGRRKPGRLTLVDMNPAQLAMCRLKFALARDCSPEESCALLGHTAMPSEIRARRLSEIFLRAGIASDAFGPADFVVEHGPAKVGRYERVFAALREELASGAGLDEAMRRVMALGNLVALFGAEATRNPAIPFHEHFTERFRIALAAPGAARNPFLNEPLSGGFFSGPAYDWLCEEGPSTEPVFVLGRMTEVLSGMPEASVDMVHLSNLLDWLTPEAAASCLCAASRVLRPGGKVIVRKLNSTIDIPGVRCGVRWDAEWGRSLQSRDRSFFYPSIFVGERA